MKYPKITIITPSFNQGHFIEQTIDSVLSQNYSNLEYIIVDGKSTDHTVSIIKKYEKYLTYWVSEADKGQTDAINKGLKVATGDIVNWLNSDDYYEPDVLYKITEGFGYEKINVICGREKLVTTDGKFIRYSRGTDVYENNLVKTIGWARMDQPETFFRRSVLEKIGALDESLHYLMDRDLWIRYLLLYGLEGVKKIPDVLVNFRLHEESKTVSQNDFFQIDHDSFFYSMATQYQLDEKKDIIKSMCKVNEGFVLKIPSNIDKDFIERILTYYFLKRGNEFYALNERKKAKVLLEQVDTSHLASEDQRLFKSLFFRNTFIPVSVLQLIRKN